MAPIRFAAMAIVATVAASCNPERKTQCDHFVEAMKPLEGVAPSLETVNRVKQAIQGLTLNDQPLQIYAENYQRTLTVLSNTLQLQASPSAPDGTDDVVKRHVKEAQTDLQDLERYCAQ